MRFSRFIVFSTISLVAANASADDYKVYRPQVTKGEFAAEANINYSFDHRKEMDNYFSQVLGFEYGVTNYWQTELSGEFEKETGSHDKLTNLKWENIFVPFAHGENWMDVGLYVEFEKGMEDDSPNNLEGKLLLEKEFGKFDNTANLIVSHEFGPNHSTDTEGGLAFQTTYRYSRMFQPGIEYYANFGDLNHTAAFNDQDHKIGPVVEGKIGNVNYNTGVLFGLSEGAQDTTVKLNLEYEF